MVEETILEKIDSIRSRFPVSYEKAKETLEKTDGNLVEAIILLEREEKEGPASEILEKAKYLWQAGNRTTIRIKKDDRLLIKIPATLGVFGVVVAPHLTFLGTITALLNKCQIDLTKEESSPDTTD